MNIRPDDPTPAYLQIAADLRASIDRGELSDGDRLPSLRNLREHYSSAAGTVQRALEELQNEGLVITLQGKGTFVRNPRRLQRFGSRRHILAERPRGKGPLEFEAESQDFNRQQIVREVSIASANSNIAKRLQIEPENIVIIRDYLLLIDNQPAQIAISYFPEHIASGNMLARKEKIPGGVHAYLVNDLKIQLNPYAIEELIARMPTPSERQTLSLGPGSPVIELWRTFVDDSDHPIEVTYFLLAADRHTLIYEVPLH